MGAKVAYGAQEVTAYLGAIYTALFEYDQLISGLMFGLAGGNIREAISIFTDICRSGYLSGKDVFGARMTGGIYRLQRHTVLNMLMRGNRRYYDADKSVVRNLLQCANERMRDYAARIGIVEWLHGNRHEEGPAGAVGFHRFSDLCQDLIGAGHDAATVREQADYLLRCALIECEHQEPIIKDEGDLLRISASGVVHYGLLKDATYIAACAEDTLVDDIVIAQDILQGMTLANAEKGYSRESVDINSAVLLNYLTEQERIFCTGLPPENRARDCYRSADYIRA